MTRGLFSIPKLLALEYIDDAHLRSFLSQIFRSMLQSQRQEDGVLAPQQLTRGLSQLNLAPRLHVSRRALMFQLSTLPILRRA